MSRSIEQLKKLSRIINERNKLETDAFEIIKAPFEIGNIGEFIASNIFDIELNDSRSHAGHDGFFKGGKLSGKSVNIKFYSKRDNLLDINKKHQPDYYLVLSGPKNGIYNKWSIKNIYLFENIKLMETLNLRGVKIGTATSVVNSLWNQSEIYPLSTSSDLKLSKDQNELIKIFERHE